MRHLKWLLMTMVFFLAFSQSAQASPVINEFSASTVGTDLEFIELFGAHNTNYGAYSILEIEGDAGSAAGVIDEVITVGTTNALGYWLASLASNSLENGTMSLLLVLNFTGAFGDDLDTNNDGIFDVTPWNSIVDSIALHDGGAGDLTYGVPVLGPYYDGLPFAPGGASRIPNGIDTDTAFDWVRNDFDLAGISGYTGTLVQGEAFNTPGAVNTPHTSVPEPTSMLLLGLGLMGLAGMRRKMQK